jgi:hypothetical protein
MNLSFSLKGIRGILLGLSLALLVFMSIEPLRTAFGPVQLMGEYVYPYSTTRLQIGLVNNKAFLDRLDVSALMAKGFDIPPGSGGPDALSGAIGRLMRRPLRARGEKLLFTVDSVEPSQGGAALVPGEKVSVRVKDLSDFLKMNILEYSHQNMGRGQINHIGHVLNPINEYICGKPLRDIYLQYGVGNSFLIKYAMDLFGGPSYSAYYKVYLFYPLYFAVSLLMLVLLFREPLHVLGALAVYAFAYFWIGYIAFVLAPGIVPSIHLMDAPVVMAVMLFLQKPSLVRLIPVTVLGLLAVAINTTFGLIITVSAFLALALHSFENRVGQARVAWLILLTVVLAGTVFLPTSLAKAGPEHLLKYFLLGFFSWPPPGFMPILTVAYLVASYGFLYSLKSERYPLKYVYLLVFLYSQGLLLYYYWSGLTNHLPMALPFIGLQFFLMLYITGKRLKNPLITLTTGGAVAAALVLCCVASYGFFKERRSFDSHFRSHHLYTWDFDRANVLTTMDPAPFAEAIGLIQRYGSHHESGIYIISKYDNLLPFLSHRYSMMPTFELGYYLISERQFFESARILQHGRPVWLFVDSDLMSYASGRSNDLWGKLFPAGSQAVERDSRVGRYLQLQRLFTGVMGDYEEVEHGRLISVYRRKTPGT